MSRKIAGLVVVALVAVFLAGVTTVKVQAQLVVQNMKVKIVKVDRAMNRLEVRVHEGGNTNIQYVLIDGNTKFSHKNKQLTLDQAWSQFKPNMIVRVKGGMTWDIKVKAKSIYW